MFLGPDRALFRDGTDGAVGPDESLSSAHGQPLTRQLLAQGAGEAKRGAGLNTPHSSSSAANEEGGGGKLNMLRFFRGLDPSRKVAQYQTGR